MITYNMKYLQVEVKLIFLYKNTPIKVQDQPTVFSAVTCFKELTDMETKSSFIFLKTHSQCLSYYSVDTDCFRASRVFKGHSNF